MPKPQHQNDPQGLLDDVAARYFAGQTLTQIGAALGYTHSRICQLLQKFRAQMREKNCSKFQQYIDLELLKIDKREAAAWTAWSRSRRPHKKIHKEFRNVLPAKGEIPLRTHTERQTRDGNVEFLNLAHKCAELRCKLLGLIPNDTDRGENTPAEFQTREQITEHLDSIAKKYENRVATLPPPRAL